MNDRRRNPRYRTRGNHIQLLYETTRDLLSTEQPLALVETTFAKLKRLIGLDVYFNYLLKEEKKQLHLEFYGGLEEETALAIEWLDVGCAICGTVAVERRQIVQPNLQQSTDPKTQLVRSLGLTAYSCQPLIAQGKLFGTLGFGSRSRTDFTRAETELFQALCDQIAIALERAELVSSLRQQTEELIHLNRLKDEFLAALSHELRTPLNPILGWTQMMRSQKLSPAKTAEALEIVERNVKQQVALVDDLLDVSGAIQGKLKLNLQRVDLATIVNCAIETVQFTAQAKRIAIEVGDLLPLPAMGDRDRLQQVFWNLLSNAIKFTPEGGRIKVDGSIFTPQAATCYAQVRISDNGIGISPEFLPCVFEHFRQADGSATRKYGGLGLGLSIVRHLVELHGGTAIAESPGVGGGSTFTVRLPLCREPVTPIPSIIEANSVTERQNNPVSSEALPNSPLIAGLNGLHVLLVDDDRDNLDLLRFVLQQDGAIVTALTSPLEALDLIPKNPPDLIVSDVGMPNIDGYDFIRQVRALPHSRQIPAFALTAFAQQEDREKAIQAGFQAYITKPVNPLELLLNLTEFVQR